MWMSPDPRNDPDGTARHLGAIATEAGRFLAAVTDRAAGRCEKPDGSPTTCADLESERLILGRLAEAWPGIPVVAEESAAATAAAALFFLVDPLDGTKDYLSGAGEYSVNIALVAGRRPVAAAVAAPSVERVWVAGSSATVVAQTGSGIPQNWTKAAARPAPEAGVIALASRRHDDAAGEACLSHYQLAERRVASSAYKFCLIASGEADLYVRCGPTMEWDTAAGDHILAGAGGIVLGPSGPLTYGHAERGFLNGPFAALGDPSLADRLRLPAACAG